MIFETEVVEPLRKGSNFLRLGPPAVLISFSYVLTVTVLTDLIVYKTCMVSSDINATECSLLRMNASSQEAVNLETKVAPQASVIVMCHSLIKSILPAVICLFLGPWSDRGGRKPVLFAAIIGSGIMFGILAMICNLDISPWYLLLATVPSNIVGGVVTARLALACIISDTTGDKTRMVQLTLLEVTISVGNALGGFSGPLIYRSYGYSAIFTTAAICCAVALAYTYFWISETVDNTSKESIRGLFRLSSVKELIASTIVKREGFHRLIVWLAILSLSLYILVARGDFTVEFLYTRARLGWDVQQYQYYDAADAVLRIAALCGVSLRSRISAVPDTVMAGVGFVSALGSAMTKSLAWRTWHMYLTLCIGILSGIIVPVMQSITSKFVPAEDVGKVFSLLALLEILSTACGAPLYTFVYSNYLPPIYPSPVCLVSVGVLSASILCVIWIATLIRKDRKLQIYAAARQEDPQY